MLSVLLLTSCVDAQGNPLGSSNLTPIHTKIANTPNVVVYGDDALGGIQAFRVDNLTQSFVTLPYEHFELHEGHVYSFCGVSNMTGSGNYTLLLITPAQPIHIQFEVDTEAEASFNLYEAVTTSNNGTPQTAINRARTSNNTAQSLVFVTPTITNLGTMLCQRHWGSGKGVGGGASISEEWMFKPNTVYVVRITNETVSSQWASIDMLWYVH